MKIGIITFHRVDNIGAVLQASALQYYIQENINECELIDYYPNGVLKKHYRIAHRILHWGKVFLTFHNSYKSVKKDQAFCKYRKQYFRISKNTYFGDGEIEANPPYYDYLISGSDQILNTSLTGNSSSYYLKFGSDKNKISYGSSFGREVISDEEKKLIKEELSKFLLISVREESAAEIIKKVANLESKLVVDPVFLVSSCEWNKRCNNHLLLPEKYIFVYTMENSTILENLVEGVKKIYALPVIIVRGGGEAGRIKGEEDFSCGPKEFLRYIRDAEIVITNSFHGTAFSIIFGKRFLCVAHSCRNVRLKNLLKLIQEENNLVEKLNPDELITEKIISGETSYGKLKDIIDFSKQFLDSIKTLKPEERQNGD